MILRDYHCTQHGYFEGWQDKCPIKSCSGEISIVHLKPVGLKSDRTKNADKTLAGLAKEFDMTDIKSTREGEHQSGYITRNNTATTEEHDRAIEAASQAQPEYQAGNNVLWGNQGAVNMQSIMGGMYKPVADEAVSVVPKAVGATKGPRTASYIADHENLKVKP